MEVLALSVLFELFILLPTSQRLIQTVLDASVKLCLLPVQLHLSAGVLVEADHELSPEDEFPVDGAAAELACPAVAVA